MRRLLALLILIAPCQAFALLIPSLPAHMCALDVQRPAERVFFDYLQSALQGSNQLAAAFADCDELKQLSTGQRDSVSHYGTILKQNLQLNMSRAEYLSTAETMIASNPNLLGEAMAQAQTATDKAITDNNLSGAGSPMSAISQGVIYKNDNVAVMAVQQTHMVNARPVKVACVAGITLIGTVPVTINLYGPAEEQGIVGKERDAIVTYAPQLLTANP